MANSDEVKDTTIIRKPTGVGGLIGSLANNANFNYFSEVSLSNQKDSDLLSKLSLSVVTEDNTKSISSALSLDPAPTDDGFVPDLTSPTAPSVYTSTTDGECKAPRPPTDSDPQGPSTQDQTPPGTASPTTPDISPGPGNNWYDPLCADCCHSETNTYLDFFNVVTIISVDNSINSQIMQFTKDINASQEPETTKLNLKFIKYFQETVIPTAENNSDFVQIRYLGLQQIGSKIPKVSRTITTSIYKFENILNFDVPDSIDTAYAFNFIELDIENVNATFGLNLNQAQRIQSPITIIEAFNLQTNSAPINTRVKLIEDSLEKAGTVDLIKAIKDQRLNPDNTIQHDFWVTKNDNDVNTTFFGFNRTQLLTKLSFLSNLKDDSIYINSRIDKIEITKIDIENESASKFLIDSYEEVSGFFKQNDSLDSKPGIAIKLANIKQLELQNQNFRLLKIHDFTTSPDKFKYLVNFVFKDPSIEYLKRSLNILRNSYNTCEKIYSVYHATMLNGGAGLDQKYLSYVNNSFSRCIDAYVDILNKFGTTPKNTRKYLENISRIKANSQSHDAFLKIIRLLLETLDKVTEGLFQKEDADIVSKNSLSSGQKTKFYLEKQFESKTLINTEDFGFDFLSSKSNIDAVNTVESSSIAFDELSYTAGDLDDRGNLELFKFWNDIPSPEEIPAGTTLTQIIESAKFNLTPNLIVSGDRQINISSIPSYSELFEKKINAIPEALKGKIGQTNDGFIDIEVPGASVQITQNNLDLRLSPSTYYFENNEELISGNLDGFDENQTNFSDIKEILKIFGPTAQAEFENNFEKVNSDKVPDLTQGPDSLLKKRSLNTLPPSYQSYILRTNNKSLFSDDKGKYENLSDSKNSSIVNNFMNLVGRIEYLTINEENLKSFKWASLNSDVLNKSSFLFCRITFLEDDQLNLKNKDNSLIFKRYFSLVRR